MKYHGNLYQCLFTPRLSFFFSQKTAASANTFIEEQDSTPAVLARRPGDILDTPLVDCRDNNTHTHTCAQFRIAQSNVWTVSGESGNLGKKKHELWEKVKTCVRLNAKKSKVITQKIFPEHPPLATARLTLLKEVRGSPGARWSTQLSKCFR